MKKRQKRDLKESTQGSKLIRTVNIYIIYMDMLHLNNYVNIETVVFIYSLKLKMRGGTLVILQDEDSMGTYKKKHKKNQNKK